MRTKAFQRQRAARLPVLQTLLLLGAASLSASVSAGASVKGAWVDGASRKQTFARVLVVGISPNVDQRCPFERELATRIKNESTFAVASCDVVAQKNPLTRESIESAVASQNADAVIATSLISKAWSVAEGNGADTRADGFYKATDAYYGYYGTVVAADFQTSDSVYDVERPSAHHLEGLRDAWRDGRVHHRHVREERRVRRRRSHRDHIPIGKRMRKDGLIR